MEVDKCILFVDDDPLILKFLESKFSDKYTLFFAADVATGLRLYKQHHIRVIYSDIVLPQQSGLDLCRAIRMEDPVSIIVAMTAHRKITGVFECREAGFDDYLLKPFDMVLLTNSLQNSVAKMARWFQKDRFLGLNPGE